MKNLSIIVTLVVFLLVSTIPISGKLSGESPEGLKLYVTSSGRLLLDKGWFTAMIDVGKEIDVPVGMYIIDHPRGLVVYDTGMNVAVAPDRGQQYWGAVADVFVPVMERDEGIDRQLQKIGYSTDDVKYVITSHFHLDHVGNIQMFPNATHIVQKVEIQNAWWPEQWQRAAYVLEDYENTRDFNFMEIDGDWDVFGDGSIEIIDTRGHTQGHQSLIVRLPNTGTVVLAADAAYMPENLEGAIPGITWNVEASMNSIERMKMIRDREQGEIWFSHDAEQFEQHRLLPEYYD